MKSPVLLIKKLLIGSIVAAVLAFGVTTQAFSQDKPDQGKDEKTITLKVVKDDNGKVTVFDTTITTKGKEKSMQYEYVIRDYEKEIAGDSIKKHIVIRGMGPHGINRFPQSEIFFGNEDCIRKFDWNDDCEDVFIPHPPMSPQLESLLQSIPMGRIKGFQIKDRKDGKRIIIDIDDEAPMMFMAPYPHSRPDRGVRKIIIERDVEDMQVPPPPPPPPPDQPKEPAPKPDKG